MWDLDQTILSRFAIQIEAILSSLEVLLDDIDLPEPCRTWTNQMYKAGVHISNSLQTSQWAEIEFGYWSTPLGTIYGFSTILKDSQLRKVELIAIYEELYAGIYQNIAVLFDEYNSYKRFKYIRNALTKPQNSNFSSYRSEECIITEIIASPEAYYNHQCTVFSPSSNASAPIVIDSVGWILRDAVLYLRRAFFRLTSAEQGLVNIQILANLIELTFSCTQNVDTSEQIARLSDENYAKEHLVYDLIVAKEGISLLGDTFHIGLSDETVVATVQLPKRYAAYQATHGQRC
jgi:hypothetical protein